MFLKILIIGCAILPHGARCQQDGSHDSPSRLLGQEGIIIKPTPDTESIPSTGYQRLAIDSYRPSPDTDSIESNSNVNVNINSNIPSSKLPWNQLQTYQTNRPSNLQYGRYRKKKFNRFIPKIRLSPNSNIDYNFAHPGGNLKLERRRTSRRKFLMNNPNLANEDFEIFMPNEDSSVCHPMIFQAVKYLKRMELNMHKLERELRTFLLGSRDNNSDNNDYNFHEQFQ